MSTAETQAPSTEELEKAKAILSQEIERQQQQIAEMQQKAGEAMNPQQGDESATAPKPPIGPTPEMMNTKFGLLAQHDDALKAYLEQYALQFNILNYRAANTCYLDAVSTAKTMGIWKDVKDHICPFPSNAKNVQVISHGPVTTQAPATPAPTPDVSSGKTDPVKAKMKLWKQAAIAAAVLGSGVGLTLAAQEIFKGVSFNRAPDYTNTSDQFGNSFNPDDVSVEIF